ncbi:MAG: glutamine--fructose-6-phosphate transaminase (isomerizing) [Parachlamydiales bacterium]
MCGIFGYVGKNKHRAVGYCLDGLKALEYRGYDSAGIAGWIDGRISRLRVAGKVAALQESVQATGYGADCVIAHTRWATQGAPTEVNAHPHFDASDSVGVVHNGIIENYGALKARLEAQQPFSSESDTEVIAQLIQHHYEGDLLQAVQRAIGELKGAFAIAVVHRDHPDQIVACAKESPLVVGLGDGEAFVSSDTQALLKHTRKVHYLCDGEVALLTPHGVSLFDAHAAPLDRSTHTLDHEADEVTKEGYDHFMLKEIFEQPRTLRSALLGRYDEAEGNALIDELGVTPHAKQIVIVGCGTSWHAGLVAAYMIEELARIPVRVEVASEVRYKNPIIEEGTLAIALSQSGETADTLAAVRTLKTKGAKTLALCNVLGSTLYREADLTLPLRAGPEIGVASTKAFTSQLALLALLSLHLARSRHMGPEEGRAFLSALRRLPEQVERLLSRYDQIVETALGYAHFEEFFFIGRRYMFPTCLEGALKLKEISYLNACGYPAGEMKHGPIALLDAACPVVACCADRFTEEKMLSNVMEARARGAPVLGICFEDQAALRAACNDTIILPSTLDPLAPILTTAVTQILAYAIAKERKTDIDQPRNLAKSVTVE